MTIVLDSPNVAESHSARPGDLLVDVDRMTEPDLRERVEALRPGQKMLLLDREEVLREPEGYSFEAAVRERTMMGASRDVHGTLGFFFRRSDINQGTGRDGRPWETYRTRTVALAKALPQGHWFVKRGSVRESTSAPMIWTSTHIFGEDYFVEGSWVTFARRVLPEPASRAQVYPLLPDGICFDDIPSEFRRRWAGHVSGRDLVRALFGKTRYRKDLVKAVAQADPRAVCIGRSARGLVPIDWIVEFLRRNPRRSADEAPLRLAHDLRPILAQLDRTSLRRLLSVDVCAQETGSYRWISDIARVERLQVPEDVRLNADDPWRSLHDALFDPRYRDKADAARRRKELAKRRPVELSGTALSINGTIDEGRLRIEIADHELTLDTWGGYMHNCIGEYGGELRARSAWLGAVHRVGDDGGEELIANFEVTPEAILDAQLNCISKLEQLLGKYNRFLEQSVREAVEDHLRSRGVRVPPGYWGSEENEAHERARLGLRRTADLA